MPTYRITYKSSSRELPEMIEADFYRTSGRFFEFVRTGESILENTTVASVSADLVAYIATED